MNKIFDDKKWLSESLYFLKNAWKIVLAMIVGILLAMIVLSSLPNVHRAEATYYLNKSDLNSRYFTINEYHFYNLLLLDVEQMLKSKKFYSEVMAIMDQEDTGVQLAYKDFYEQLYIEIEAESTFFIVGFEHTDAEVALKVSTVIEELIVEESPAIVQITSVELVDGTELLTSPVAPDKVMIIILGVLAGLFVGMLIVMISYMLSNNINSYVDVIKLTDQMLLCHTKFKDLRHLNADNIFDKRKRSDYQVAKQFLLYDKELHGQKVFSILSSDASGKNETFALALAGHLAASGEKTLYMPINPTEKFRNLLADNYGKREVVVKNLDRKSHYNEVVENVVDALDILIATNRNISFSQDRVDEFNYLISEFEKDYDIIITSIGLEEKLIFSMIQKGAFMMAVSNKSEKTKVKNSMECLDRFEARMIGVVYQE